jgi:hypothetical protein
MDESIRPVMKSKRLLLFKEMLQDAGVKDEGLFGELCTGFRVGDLAPSGQFQQQFKPALGVEQLRQTASWAQKAVVASCRKVLQDREIAEAVWNETMDQASFELSYPTMNIDRWPQGCPVDPSSTQVPKSLSASPTLPVHPLLLWLLLA